MSRMVERQCSSRKGSRDSPWLLLFSHFIVGIVCFHYGFSAGVTTATASHNNGGGGTGTTPDFFSPTSGRGLESLNLAAAAAAGNRSSMKLESFPPESLKGLFVGSTLVARDEFIQLYDLGVPWDEPTPGAKEVLLLYGSEGSLPDHAASGSVVDATHHCDTMKVILTKNSAHNNQCLAIVPQWESYHVHKFMRLKPDGEKSDKPAYAETYPLRNVSRRHEIKGTYPSFPNSAQLSRFYSLLVDYLQKLDDTMARLKPLAEKAAAGSSSTSLSSSGQTEKKEKAIVVQVVNFGQVELLFNFVCNARARKIDLSNILVFATDSDTYELVKAIGLHVFEVGEAFGPMPTGAAQKYGDRTFQVMMLSKVYCVHLINAMGYDVLFQDVDVIWYQNPIEYFQLPISGNFDISFQDDGAHSSRYAPYSPNSGFYYVRHNDRTRFFFETFIRLGDQIIASGSHQSVMNSLLTEQASSRGLTVKVYGRDSHSGRLFPGGYHFHKRKNFMKEVINNDWEPYIFHMSWTENKANKQKFYQQLGEWYLQDRCTNKKVGEFKMEGCCSATALYQCHYKDKPSKESCKESPAIDKNGVSFW